MGITYEYQWYPEILAPVTMSTTKMVKVALTQLGLDDSKASSAKIAASAEIREKLVNALVALAEKHFGFSLHANEKALIEEVVRYYNGPLLYHSGAYGCVRALATIISARAHVGWTTRGHTGVDVNLYSYGPGS